MTANDSNFRSRRRPTRPSSHLVGLVIVIANDRRWLDGRVCPNDLRHVPL